MSELDFLKEIRDDIAGVLFQAEKDDARWRGESIARLARMKHKVTRRIANLKLATQDKEKVEIS